MWGSATFPLGTRDTGDQAVSRAPIFSTGALRAGGAEDEKRTVSAGQLTGFALTFHPKEMCLAIPV